MQQPSLRQGTLEETRIPEIISLLSKQKQTGALHIQRHHQEKILYFEDGRLVFAASNDPDQRLGVFLLRRAKVTYRQLQDCAPKVAPGKRLGTILVLDGIIQPNELYQGVLEQIKEIIYSVFEWENGKYSFQSGPLPQKEVITLNLSTPDLVLTGMQRIWRWSWIKKALPSLDAVFRKSREWSAVARNMTLSRETESIIDLFARPRTLQEVLQMSRLGDFETCRLLWGLLIIGVIEEILLAPAWSDDSVATERMQKPVVQSVTSPAAEITESNAQESSQLTDVQTLDTLLAQTPPYEELSFADLAEFSALKEEDRPPNSDAQQVTQLEWKSQLSSDLNELNELHRYIFEMIHLDFGGASGGVLSRAFTKASTRYPLVFEGVSLNEFGELDKQILLENIEGNVAKDYREAFDYLISEERSMMQSTLDSRRVSTIDSGIKRIRNRRYQAMM